MFFNKKNKAQTEMQNALTQAQTEMQNSLDKTKSLEYLVQNSQKIISNLVRNGNTTKNGTMFYQNGNSIKADYVDILSTEVDSMMYFTRFWPLLDALYKDEGFIQRIISLYSDGLKNFNINNIDEEQYGNVLKKLNKVNVKYGINSINNTITQIAQKTALYGGCVILMVNSEKEMNPYSFDFTGELDVKFGDNIYIEVFAPHECFRAEMMNNSESNKIDNEYYLNFYDNNTYVNIRRHGKTITNIHPSRILKIKSNFLQPSTGLIGVLRGFGYSVLEGLLLPWLNYKNVLYSTSEIVENLHKVILTLGENDVYNQESEQAMSESIKKLDHLMNSKNGSVIPMSFGTDLKNLDTSANPSNFVTIALDYIAHTLGISKTILFGEQSGGMAKDDNSQAEIDKFYTKNQEYFKPYIEYIIENLVYPAIGIDDECNISYLPNRKPTAFEKSQIDMNTINIISNMIASGLLTKEQAINAINQNEVINYKIDSAELDVSREYDNDILKDYNSDLDENEQEKKQDSEII